MPTTTIPTPYKMPAEHRYFELSGYGRPAGIWLARKLQKTFVKGYQVAFIHLGISVCAAYLLTLGLGLSRYVAIALIGLKVILDNTDGSLARLKNEVTLAGRYLDSNIDFISSFLLFACLPGVSVFHRLGGFVSFLLQGTFFVYYLGMYRATFSGAAARDDGSIKTKLGKFFYTIFYAWQDVVANFVETKIVKGGNQKIPKFFMTLLSLHGLAFQLAIIMFAIVIKKPIAACYWFYAMNCVMVATIAIRKITTNASRPKTSR